MSQKQHLSRHLMVQQDTLRDRECHHMPILPIVVISDLLRRTNLFKVFHDRTYLSHKTVSRYTKTGAVGINRLLPLTITYTGLPVGILG